MTFPSTGDLWRALAAAEAAHRGQTRKVAPVPYILHPLGVAQKILAYGFPAHPLAVAALLHDTVEHGRLTIEQIRETFGPEVAALVEALSHINDGGGWRERKTAAIEGLRPAPDAVVTLACADKLDNLLSVRDDCRRLGELVWERLGRSRDEQAWYYRSLAAVFEERAVDHEAPAMLFDFVDLVKEVFGEEGGSAGPGRKPSLLNVRIRTLPGMWVAAFHAKGEAPEEDAWRRLKEWAGPRGLLAEPERHPVFGFTNPPPTAGSRAYGYELWIRVDAPEQAAGAGGCKQFPGGLFAVAACRLLGEPDIVTAWRMLWDWTKTSRYPWRSAQELERILNPEAPAGEMAIELYLPVSFTRARGVRDPDRKP